MRLLYFLNYYTISSPTNQWFRIIRAFHQRPAPIIDTHYFHKLFYNIYNRVPKSITYVHLSLIYHGSQDLSYLIQASQLQKSADELTQSTLCNTHGQYNGEENA